jgi:hypothetical protein
LASSLGERITAGLDPNLPHSGGALPHAASHGGDGRPGE